MGALCLLMGFWWSSEVCSLGGFWVFFLDFQPMRRVAYHHEVFKLQLRICCTPWGLARWLVCVWRDIGFARAASQEQGGGSWTWCSPAQTTLWAWCLERPISETTPVLWFGGNRWLVPQRGVWMYMSSCALWAAETQNLQMKLGVKLI